MTLNRRTLRLSVGFFLSVSLPGITSFADNNLFKNEESNINASIGKPDCCVFPLRDRPTQSYLTNPRNFGANRANGRLHAACDLYRPSVGEVVRAVEGGQVIRGPYLFYQGTYALEVKHDSGFVARYGEITSKKVPGVEPGAKVTRGQMIGYLGKVNSNCCSPMLNFELFAGTATGPLTQDRRPYQRRSDLLNPTSSLQVWERKSFGESYLYKKGEKKGAPTPDESTSMLESYLIPMIQSVREIKNPNELQSILALLLTSALNSTDPRELVAELESLQFSVKLSFDTSATTGSLLTINSKTNSNSSYGHVRALFFGEGVDSTLALSGNFILQHLSADTKSNIGMASLKENLNSLLGSPIAPEVETNDFAQWRLPKGYVLWMKKIEDDETQNFDDMREKGSIRIAVELMP